MGQPKIVAGSKPEPTVKSVGLMILVSMLIALLVIEATLYFLPELVPEGARVLLRGGYQLDDAQAYIPVDGLGYAYAPGLVDYVIPAGEGDEYTVSTVSFGYDDIGFRDEGIDDQPFAVVIGDSFASCFRVEPETCWVELLEKKTGRDFANLGVPGYGPQQEQYMLLNYGIPLKPKLVLWVYFANDLINAQEVWQFGSNIAGGGELLNNPITAWLAGNSAIFAIVNYVWHNRFFIHYLFFADDQTVAADPTLAWWLANGDVHIPEVAAGLRLSQEAILNGKRYTQTALSDAKFVVVIIPFLEQSKYGDSPYQPRLDSSSQAIVDYCRQNDITVIDFTPEVKEAFKQTPAPLYFEQDPHLTVRGNELVAELLKQKLDEVLTE